jgi:polar amino acid transport system permease protein
MQVFTRVVLPPALQRVWPALVSQIIIVMLGSAVCGQISTPELSYAANLIQSRNFRAFESFIVATLVYLALAMLLRRLLTWAGRVSSLGGEMSLPVCVRRLSRSARRADRRSGAPAPARPRLCSRRPSK